VSRLHYVGAFLAGATAVLGFGPVGIYPLLLIALALLAHLWMRAAQQQAFWLGGCFGLGLFAAGASWIYISLSQFGGMPAALAGIITVLFCLLLALFPAGAGWLQARIPAGDAMRALLLIPAAWTLFEWLRGWIFTGFPWLSVGYAGTGWPMQGYAPLAGLYGASFLSLVLAGCIPRAVRGTRKLPFAIVFLVILGLGEALRSIAWTVPQAKPFSAALLQGNIEQQLKFQPERYARILETYAALAEGSSARLIVLPETAIPRFQDRVDPAYFARLEAAAKRNGGDLLFGIPYHAGQAQYYNSVLSIGVSPRQAYHKAHLVPFGEFMPIGFHWVLRALDIPLADFSAGAAEQPPLAVAGERVAVNICYEDSFGMEIARAAADATLLVNASNVAWFGDSLAPGQHLQIARLRAIETGRMHLAATNTGISAAIDRDGRVLARLPQFTEGRLELSAQGYSGETPYMRLGDWPILAGCVLLLGIAVLRARSRR
jgi:apolipoprotein N-acyltransferase